MITDDESCGRGSNGRLAISSRRSLRRYVPASDESESRQEVNLATTEQMNELLGRMITDDGFRKELMADPQAAAAAAAAAKSGYDLTSEQLSQIETPEMGELIGAVDERVSKRFRGT